MAGDGKSGEKKKKKSGMLWRVPSLNETIETVSESN